MGVKHLISMLFILNIFPQSIKKIPVKEGYNKACDKIPADIIRDLFRKAHNLEFNSSNNLYNGMKTVIVDGTYVILPRTDETVDKYGLGSGTAGSAYYPQTQTAGFFELSTGTFEDFKFDNVKTPERRLMLAHANENKSPTLYMGDAGFSGIGFNGIIKLKCNHDVLVQAKQSSLIIKKFRDSGKRSLAVEFKLTRAHLLRYPEHMDLQDKILKLRLVRTRGTTKLRSQILITTLLDEKIYKWEELSKLYLQRYKIELAFRHLKSKIKIEKIKKQKRQRIEQLLYAAILLFNISAMLRNSVKKRSFIPEKKGEKIYSLEFCTELVNEFVSSVIKPYRTMKAKLKHCINAIKSCYSINRPWRVYPRICQFPSSVFTRQKTSLKNSEHKKVEFLAEEYKILGIEYGIL